MDCLIISYSEADRKRERNQFYKAETKFGSDWSRFLHLNYVPYNGDIILPNQLASLARLNRLGVAPKKTELGFLDYEDISEYSVWKIPLLGGLFLYQYFAARNMDVKIIQHVQMETTALEAYLSQKPKVVAISSTLILNPIDIYKLVSFCKKRSPESLIVVGGIGVWNNYLSNKNAPDYFKPLKADIVVLDPRGFRTLEKIIRKRMKGESVEGVENTICYSNSGTVVGSKNQEEYSFIDDGMDWERIDNGLLKGIAQVRTQVSCPFACAFCSYPVAQGAVITQPQDLFENELRILQNKGVTHLIFVDDTFNVPPKRFKMMLDVLKKYRLKWYAFIRVQFLTEELVQDMVESNCAGVFYGIESADDEILKKMNKKSTRAAYLRGVEMIAKKGITSYASFIVGFPGESEASIQNTKDFIENSGIDYYNIKVFYYETSTPVDLKKDEYKLSGQGMEWSHSTMTSEQAFGHVERLIREIKHVPYIPQHSGELWEIAHFHEKGIPKEGIRKLYSNFTDLLKAELGGKSNGEINTLVERSIGELSHYF